MLRTVVLLCVLSGAAAILSADNRRLQWIVGKWRSEFGGKVFWPTVPTMTYGEEMIIQEAPLARSSGVQFLNFRFVFVGFVGRIPNNMRPSRGCLTSLAH
jgi:hypothetical protein